MPLSKDPIKRARQLANITPKSFKKGQSGNPNGRPRTTIRALVESFEAEGMVMPSPTEISKIYVYIATRTEDELKAILADKSLPMMTRIVARGVLDKKGLDILERIIDRAYGKEQRIDLTTNGKELHVEPLQIRFVANREELERIKAEVPSLEQEGDKQ